MGFHQTRRIRIGTSWHFFSLFTLTLLDTSGGLAFLSLYVLLVISSLRFKNQFFMSAAPFALILFGSRMANPGDVIYELWHYLGLGEVEIFVIADLGLPRLSGILMATSAFFVLTLVSLKQRKIMANISLSSGPLFGFLLECLQPYPRPLEFIFESYIYDGCLQHTYWEN